MATKKIFKLQKKKSFGSLPKKKRKKKNFLIEWHFIFLQVKSGEEKKTNL